MIQRGLAASVFFHLGLYIITLQRLETIWGDRAWSHELKMMNNSAQMRPTRLQSSEKALTIPKKELLDYGQKNHQK